MPVAELEVKLREWLDRLEIRDLIYRYSDAVFVPIYAGHGCVTGDLLTARSALLRPIAES